MDTKVKIDWSAAYGEPIRPVNQYVVQAGPHEHILTLGFIAPPIVLDLDDQERFKAMKSIPVDVVARILLTPAAMRELAGVLSKHIAKSEAKK